MPESPPEIEIANLVWRPAGAAAPTLDLRGYSLHVRGGETLLISGASGAGKSTLAAACAGLLGTLVPGELQGTLRVGGVDLVAAAAARERVSQNYGSLLHAAITPLRAVRISVAGNAGVPDRRVRVRPVFPVAQSF